MRLSLFFSSSFLLISSVIICVIANDITIKTITEFENLANTLSQSSSGEHNIVLEADLDFKTSSFKVPLGVNAAGKCNPFVGTFDGKNHTISNLNMDNIANTKYSNAGLFCDVKAAVIRSLIIGKTCSFKGIISGAISAQINGSATFSHVSNNGQITGKTFLGGLIGSVYDAKLSNIVFDDCSNAGSVKGDDNNDDHEYGGVIGIVWNTVGCKIVINNTVNKGSVSGKHHCGGFIGLLQNNHQLTFVLSNSKNEGNIDATQTEKAVAASGLIAMVHANPELTMIVDRVLNSANVSSKTNGGLSANSYSGGLISFIIANNKLKLTINNSVNNGNIQALEANGCFVGGIIGLLIDWNDGAIVNLYSNVNNGKIFGTSGTVYGGGVIGLIRNNTGLEFMMKGNVNNGLITRLNSGDSRVGGLIGAIQGINARIVVNNSVNRMNVTVDTYGYFVHAGGIIGVVENPETGENETVELNDCMNRGCVVATKGSSRGLIGVQVPSSVTVILLNSINKGDVRGAFSYGISDTITAAWAIVSLGVVSGSNSSNSFMFWKGFSKGDYYFCNGNNIYCQGRKVIENASGYFVDGSRLDTLLNQNAFVNHYTSGWSRNLEALTYNVHFGRPLEKTVPVIPEQSLNTMFSRSPELFPSGWRDYEWYEGESGNKYNFDLILTKDITLFRYIYITLIGDITDTVPAKEGQTLGQLLDSSIFDNFILSEAGDKRAFLNSSVVVTNNIAILARKIIDVHITLEMKEGYTIDDMTRELSVVMNDYGFTVKQTIATIDEDGLLTVILRIPKDEESRFNDLISLCTKN